MRPSTASSESKKRSPWRRNGARPTMTSAATRRSCRNRRASADRLDERMEHADAELARILAGPAADLQGDERLVDRNLKLGHLGGAHLIRFDGDPSQNRPPLRRQLEFVENHA